MTLKLCITGLMQILQQEIAIQASKTPEQCRQRLPSTVDLPVKFATVQAAISSNKPQLDQASLYSDVLIRTFCIEQKATG